MALQGSGVSLFSGVGLGASYLHMSKNVDAYRGILTRISAVLCALMAYRATKKLMPAAPLAVLAALATLVYRRDINL